MVFLGNNSCLLSNTAEEFRVDIKKKCRKADFKDNGSNGFRDPVLSPSELHQQYPQDLSLIFCGCVDYSFWQSSNALES